ncbi:hypothetical protein [Mycobacterium decipiens]|uniref:DUF732 domain-containing protein n=1 Tax=Mycobacterium decipiens TaxID=1430326 RepID=A0A1X2LSY8_9MYCO|nr:hypothetical protein [Mycobacterium decipiens]OSC39220.1 hypothetical protein B8W66_18035 [Mycobacterium decipiens]
MKRHRFAAGLIAGLLGVLALVGGTGVARADPLDPDTAPPIIDDFIALIPALTLDPRDRNRPPTDPAHVGMYCLNQFVRCQIHGFERTYDTGP